MRVYISADIEGIAAVVSRANQMPEGFGWPEARRWMTDAVVAACEAASDAGATEIVVSDSHGPMQNIFPDLLPDRVQLVRGSPRPLAMMQGIEHGRYEAAMFIGYHTSAVAEGGVLGHTIRGTAVRDIRFNGRSMPEAGVNAAIAGHFGVPVVMASGDDLCMAEIGALIPGIRCATVKWAHGLLAARCLSPRAEQLLIRRTVAEALDRRQEIAPFRMQGPISLELDFKHRLPAELLALLRGVERTHVSGIRYEVADAVEASKFLVFALSYSATLT